MLDTPRSKRRVDDENANHPHGRGFCVLEDPPTIIGMKFTDTNARVIAVDTLNWFRCSVRDLGESIGLPKLEMPEWEADDEKWFDYCERDTEIIERSFLSLVDFVSDNEFGMFRYTASGQAMAAYRHRFMETSILFHDEIGVKKLERRSFLGGRTEVFRRGKIPCKVYQLDISSLYPYVMRLNKFPVKLLRWEERGNTMPLFPAINPANSVADVVLRARSAIYPAKLNGVTMFPLGYFGTTLAGPELALAWNSGELLEVGSWAEYETADIFRLYVDELWQLRQDFATAGNNMYANLCKILLNSLFGKFGQRQSRWETIDGRIAPAPWSQWIEGECGKANIRRMRSVGWEVQIETEREEIEKTFPAISAFVTSHGRIYMNYIRQTAGHENVFYQGVDSLIVSEDGYDLLKAAGLVAERTLGKLRLQCETFDCEIFGTMDYRLGEKLVIGGLPQNRVEKEHGQYMMKKFSGASQLFRGLASHEITEDTVTWNRLSGVAKSQFQPDGSSLPFVLNEPTPLNTN